MTKKNKEQMEIDIFSEVHNTVDVNDLASIAVARHERKLEAAEKTLVDDITGAKTSIKGIKGVMYGAFEADAAKALKSSGIDKVAKAMSNYTGKTHTTSNEISGSYFLSKDSVEALSEEEFSVVLTVKDDNKNTKFSDIKTLPTPKTHAANADKVKALNDYVSTLQERLGAVRRELRDIAKLERQAKANIAEHNVSKVDGGSEFLDSIDGGGDLMHGNSVLSLPAITK